MTQIDKGTLAAAKDLLEQHKQATNSIQRKQNFDRLWAVLEELRSAGVSKFNLAEVGRRLHALGGPKAQSLRNSTGVAFREVICLYESSFKSAKPGVEVDEIERSLSTITNKNAQIVLRAVATEAKEVMKERNHLKGALLALTEEFSKSQATQKRPPALSQSLPDWTLEAIRSNLDQSRLMERGLSVTEDGRLLDERSITLLGPDFLGAINEILTLQGKPPLNLRQP